RAGLRFGLARPLLEAPGGAVRGGGIPRLPRRPPALAGGAPAPGGAAVDVVFPDRLSLRRAAVPGCNRGPRTAARSRPHHHSVRWGCRVPTTQGGALASVGRGGRTRADLC